jgi:membrane-bound lytic murein transglycosylase B
MKAPAALFLIISLLLQHKIYAQIDQSLVDDFARNYAYQHKLSLAEVEAILVKAEFQPSIIEKMEKPAEKSLTWTGYRNIFMTNDRINAGVEFWKENENTLNKVSADTGVPEEIILGILGVETFFGQRKGSYKVLDALYTLAFGYPKRSKFFTSELEKLLELSEQENLDINNIKGSYAGAIGYCQFMPSSYIAYAKSYKQDGNRDLVNSVDDAIASIANYMAVHRWENGKPIAQKAVATDDNISLEKQSLKPKNNLNYYQNLGFETEDKKTTNEPVTLIDLELDNGKEYWFGYDNFYVITRYNHSPMYALAVYQLGLAVKEKKLAAK